MLEISQLFKTKKISIQKKLVPNLKIKKSQGVKLKIICNMIEYLQISKWRA